MYCEINVGKKKAEEISEYGPLKGELQKRCGDLFAKIPGCPKLYFVFVSKNLPCLVLKEFCGMSFRQSE